MQNHHHLFSRYDVVALISSCSILILGTFFYTYHGSHVLAAPFVVVISVVLFILLDERDCRTPASVQDALLPLFSDCHPGWVEDEEQQHHHEDRRTSVATRDDLYFTHKNNTLDLTSMGYVWVGWLVYGLLFEHVHLWLQEVTWLPYVQSSIVVPLVLLTYWSVVRERPALVTAILCVNTAVLFMPHTDNIAHNMPLILILAKVIVFAVIYLAANLSQLMIERWSRHSERLKREWRTVRFLRRSQYMYWLQLRLLQSSWVLLAQRYVMIVGACIQTVALLVRIIFLVAEYYADQRLDHDRLLIPPPISAEHQRPIVDVFDLPLPPPLSSSSSTIGMLHPEEEKRPQTMVMEKRSSPPTTKSSQRPPPPTAVNKKKSPPPPLPPPPTTTSRISSQDLLLWESNNLPEEMRVAIQRVVVQTPP